MRVYIIYSACFRMAFMHSLVPIYICTQIQNTYTEEHKQNQRKIKRLTWEERGPRAESSWRTRSPVAMWGTPRRLERRAAYVPLPTPGQPRNTHWTFLPLGCSSTVDNFKSVSEEGFRQNPRTELTIRHRHLVTAPRKTAMDQQGIEKSQNLKVGGEKNDERSELKRDGDTGRGTSVESWNERKKEEWLWKSTWDEGERERNKAGAIFCPPHFYLNQLEHRLEFYQILGSRLRSIVNLFIIFKLRFIMQYELCTWYFIYVINNLRLYK